MTRPGFIVAAILSALAVCAAPAGAQTAFDPPRLPDGRPDLQGVWDFRTLTPLERPADLADQAIYREEEAAAIEAEADAQSAAALAPTTERSVLPVGGDVGAYNSYWMDQGARLVEDQRTSLIVDPPDGRVPPLQPGAVNQVLSLAEDVGGSLPVRVRSAGISADSHEARGLAERCILGFNTGPPILPGFYNQNIQLFQTGDHVVVLHEMIHDARIVPLDGRDHVPERIRQWMGDSRGYWEGDTLVVETTNFTDKVASFNPTVAIAAGTGATLHLTERFSLVADDTLQYEYTVNDPTTFTRPFSAVLLMKRGGTLYEYACHEGNYGLYNQLAGARQEEARASADAGE